MSKNNRIIFLKVILRGKPNRVCTKNIIRLYISRYFTKVDEVVTVSSDSESDEVQVVGEQRYLFLK